MNKWEALAVSIGLIGLTIVMSYVKKPIESYNECVQKSATQEIAKLCSNGEGK